MANEIMGSKDCKSYIKDLLSKEVSASDIAKMEKMMAKEAQALKAIMKKKEVTYEPRYHLGVHI